LIRFSAGDRPEKSNGYNVRRGIHLGADGVLEAREIGVCILQHHLTGSQALGV